MCPVTEDRELAVMKLSIIIPAYNEEIELPQLPSRNVKPKPSNEVVFGMEFRGPGS